MTGTELKINPLAATFLKEIARLGGVGREQTVTSKVFPFPSVGTTFSRITYQDKQETVVYFVKNFNPP